MTRMIITEIINNLKSLKMENNEKNRLEKIANDSWYNRGANFFTIKYAFEVFKKHFVKGSLLEMGPAEGVMTEDLVNYFDDYTIVEGSSRFCDDLKNRFPKINVIHSLFEDFNPNQKYDNIILGHVLEHVEDPVNVLRIAKKSLSENGVILAAVPNAKSLHREAAVIMGMLKTIYDLNENDIHHGHRRVYNPEQFKNDFVAAGLNVTFQGGYWLKPVSNKQIEETWSNEMLMAFMQLGEKFPEIAGETYIVAKIK